MSKKFADFPPDYADWLAGIKTRVQAARSRAALAANVELVSLYWQIGNEILQRQQVANWGDKVLDRLASDLRGAFPEMKGFSRANLKFMRAFAQAWPEPAIGQQAVSQLPWGHNVMLLTKLKDPVQRVHYAQHALVRHIIQFLLELGSGFAFIGRQFRLEVSDKEFFVDLLFYHTRLKCYVVVELKATDFKPEHAGQLNFYLTAVDRQIKAPEDNPTIGLLLCKTQDRLVAEYALHGIDKPIGVAEYELVRALPERLVNSLPTVEELESELASEAVIQDFGITASNGCKPESGRENTGK